MAPSETNAVERAAVHALNALAWVLGDPGHAARFFDLTGLDPQAIRARAGDPVFLAAVIDHLAAHEPDLIACAAALHLTPDALIRAGTALRNA